MQQGIKQLLRLIQLDSHSRDFFLLPAILFPHLAVHAIELEYKHKRIQQVQQAERPHIDFIGVQVEQKDTEWNPTDDES
ncbi:hypothetical protein BPA01_11730 [Brevibacillus parabrevis]|uniref:Uncharacterized protein n=1 Tax=Brevibacillus parabrevis TaxID=54914 RepID=A0A4Y3PDE8_BREPA|nr:hypothetical protein BPA01_11730 [Brevibacillus parabrevis]